MILENCQKRRLVADIRDLLVVEIIQPTNEGIRSAEDADQFGLIMRDEVAVPKDFSACLVPPQEERD